MSQRPLLSGAVLAAGLCFALASCGRPEAQKPAATGPQPTPVVVAPVRTTNWDRTVSIVGTLYPKDEASIAAEVDGVVDRTLVDFGDRVKAGQDIAFIDTASYQALADQAAGNLAKAEATLRAARQEFTRREELKQSGIASTSEYDQGKAALDQAEADVKAAQAAHAVAQLNVNRSRVRAPFDGAIAQRIVGKGDYVKVGAPLFEMVNDAVLKFIFQVPERYGSLVQKRLPVRFSVDNYPDEIFTGSVYLISPSVTTASRAFGVGALVTNAGFRLKANTYARGSLVLQQDAPTLVVPLEAVISFAGVTKVFVAEGQVARSRAVVVGRIRDGFQEISDGLSPGDSVVVSGQNRLSDGAPVTLQSPVPAGQAPDSKESHETH
ncbi:MAG: efflux RND transporter periplasmic adaptor subunit [Verrucomicrobiae bacterium]|nr:efflux RND transporter periplasmic adaptor subunit [Verrucomicrobiae bacterium]